MDKFRGLNGTLVIEENRVIITREKLLDSAFHKKGIKEIYFSDITGLVIKKGFLVNGYISVLENNEKGPSGITDAMKDGNTIIFRLYDNENALSIYNSLKEKINVKTKRKNPAILTSIIFVLIIILIISLLIILQQ